MRKLICEMAGSGIVMLCIAGVLGLGRGFQPVCGFNYGAKRYDRVKKAFRFCVALSTAALTVMAILCFTFAPDVIALFRKDDFEVVKMGAFMLRAQCLSFQIMKGNHRRNHHYINNVAYRIQRKRINSRPSIASNS